MLKFIRALSLSRNELNAQAHLGLIISGYEIFEEEFITAKFRKASQYFGQQIFPENKKKFLKQDSNMFKEGKNESRYSTMRR